MRSILTFAAGVVVGAALPKVPKNIIRPAVKCVMKCYRASGRFCGELKACVQEELQDISAELAAEEEAAKRVAATE
jgi:hypothetical protein